MKKSNHLAFGGIFSALSLIILYMGLVINFNELFFLFLSSCCIVGLIILTDARTGLISYGAVCLLSIFFLSSHLGILFMYIFVFGLYPIVKLFLEKCRNAPIEFLFKMLFLNTGILIVFLLYNSLFAEIFKFKFGVALAIVVLQVIFLVYDYALTTFVHYFNTKFSKKIKSKKRRR